MNHHIKLTILAFSVSLLCLSALSTAYAQDTTSGLVFYLPFDGDMTEKVTGLAPDQSPGIALGDGRFGGGITASGNLSGLEYPVEILANTWLEGSTAAWIKIDESSPSTSTLIASNWYSQLTSRSRKVETQVGADANSQTASAFPHSVWTHIASTWRKSGNKVDVSFYVDGQKKITETRTLQKNPDFPKTYVAAWAGAFANSLVGDLDEVVFYNRRLSDADVAALHQGPAQGAPASPVGVRDGSVLAPTVIGRAGQLSVPEEARTALPTPPLSERNEELPVDQVRGIADAAVPASPVGVRDSSVLAPTVIGHPGQLSVPKEARTALPTPKLGERNEEFPVDRVRGISGAGGTSDPDKLPGDQFEPTKLPGDQFEPDKLPGDQFDPRQLPGDQFDPTLPNVMEESEGTAPEEIPEFMTTEERIRAGSEELLGAKKPQWEFLYVNRLGGKKKGYVSDGEHVTLQVAMKKTGPDASAPVRIVVKDANPNAPKWNGSNPGTKYDIDLSPGEIVVKEVQVNYHRRFEEGDDAYSFLVELTNPDGTPFKDANLENHEKLMAFYHTENRLKKKDAEEEQARRDANKGYERRVRRSKVAGRTGDRVWRQVGPKGALLVGLSLSVGDINGSNLQLGGVYENLGEGTKGSSLQNLENIYMGGDPDNILHAASENKNVAAEFATFGIRVGTDTADESIFLNAPTLGDRNGAYALDLWQRDTMGAKLGQDLRRVNQWNTSWRSIEWRPWSYCPEEKSGQRMIAVGFEAHIKESTNNSHLYGIRLICEPLSQALDPREGPVMYFDVNKNKWVEG